MVSSTIVASSRFPTSYRACALVLLYWIDIVCEESATSNYTSHRNIHNHQPTNQPTWGEKNNITPNENAKTQAAILKRRRLVASRTVLLLQIEKNRDSESIFRTIGG